MPAPLDDVLVNRLPGLATDCRLMTCSAWLRWSALVKGAHGVDRVCFVGTLVVAVAQHAGEAQCHATGVARRALDAVERDLDDLLGTDMHDVPVGRAVSEVEEPLRLPVEHLVRHALEGL